MKPYLKEAAALLLAIFAALFIAILVSLGAKAELPRDTDYHNNLVSEEISRQTKCENRLGYWDDRLKQCFDQNLTDNQERYLKDYTAKLEKTQWQK